MYLCSPRGSQKESRDLYSCENHNSAAASSRITILNKIFLPPLPTRFSGFEAEKRESFIIKIFSLSAALGVSALRGQGLLSAYVCARPRPLIENETPHRFVLVTSHFVSRQRCFL